MVNVAHILALNCRLLTLYNVAVIEDDARLGVGLPLMVFDKAKFSKPMQIQAALIQHHSVETTIIKIDLHRSLNGWMDNTLMLMVTDVIPKMKFLSFLCHKGVHNIIIITTNGKLYSYNPYKEQIQRNCGLKTFWRDMDGKTVKMSAFHHPIGLPALTLGSGIDGSFMYELSRKLNFTIEIIECKDFRSAIFLLLKGRSEVSINALFVNFYSKELIISHALYSDQVCVALKGGSILRGWQIFVLTFDWEVWAAIFGVALFTNWIVACFSNDRSWNDSMPLTLRAMFMIPLRSPPKGTKQRLIIGSCLLFGIVIVTTYQANLYHFIKTKVKLQLPALLSEVSLEIKNRHFNEDNLTNEVFDKYAVRVRRKLLDFLLQTGQLDDIKIVQECVNTVNLAYPLRKGAILLEPLNRYLLYSLEGGLPQAWYQRTVYTSGKRKFEQTGNNTTRVLTLRDVEVAFFALTLGLALSFLVFLLEISTLLARHWLHTRHQLAAHLPMPFAFRTSLRAQRVPCVPTLSPHPYNELVKIQELGLWAVAAGISPLARSAVTGTNLEP